MKKILSIFKIFSLRVEYEKLKTDLYQLIDAIKKDINKKDTKLPFVDVRDFVAGKAEYIHHNMNCIGTIESFMLADGKKIWLEVHNVTEEGKLSFNVIKVMSQVDHKGVTTSIMAVTIDTNRESIYY
jgi:hypothetical protein